MREVERALKFDLNIVPIRFDDSAKAIERVPDYLLATVHWLAIAPGFAGPTIVVPRNKSPPGWRSVRRTPPGAAPVPVPRFPTLGGGAPGHPARSDLSFDTIVLLVIAASLIYWLVSKNSRRPLRHANKTR